MTRYPGYVDGALRMNVGLRIRGLVQGVGFRPTVWHVANQLALRGDVRNDGDGVWVRLLDVTRNEVDSFCRRLRDALPPLARIDELQTVESIEGFDVHDFDIVASDSTTPLTGIVPDAATCPACLADIRDPDNRRYRYPFTNCTHCGPRLSIIRAIPYDRANTSMSVFPMCPACESEYRNPADRRYHAQPNACGDCGPALTITGSEDSKTDAIEVAVAALRSGKIIAIKGIGGFHLACDAHNQSAVDTLRQRKRRYAKPFALMARDLDIVERYCHVDTASRALLTSPAAPILLLRNRDGAPRLPESIAPDQVYLGFMLPYSPIHHLLLETWDAPLVMTSGNLSDEPQCIDNTEAAGKLSAIADITLLHDRDIVNRVDDSVIRVMAGKPRLLRRARGYAPAPLKLHESFRQAPSVLALGGELKNTICLLKDGQATVSQHLGDLENASTSDEFERTTSLYRRLFAFEPELIAIDKHPDYRSSRYGRDLVAREERGLVTVQHHHAHIASLMAEAGYPLDSQAVLGIALDGLGFGEDQTIWGGEFLLANFRKHTRVARLMPAAMPGGTQSIREPWRNLWAQLHANARWESTVGQHADLPIIQYLMAQPLDMLEQMQRRAINTPMTSSAGRLFDAVAAALSLHHERVYQEGQAAIALEQLALQAPLEETAYPIDWEAQENLFQSNHRAFWQALFSDLASGVDREVIAARFHRGLGNALCQLAAELSKTQTLDTIALSGGVWQNQFLLEYCMRQLQQDGLTVLHHEHVPSNDGGLSLGQAAIAAARAKPD